MHFHNVAYLFTFTFFVVELIPSLVFFLSTWLNMKTVFLKTYQQPLLWGLKIWLMFEFYLWILCGSSIVFWYVCIELITECFKRLFLSILVSLEWPFVFLFCLLNIIHSSSNLWTSCLNVKNLRKARSNSLKWLWIKFQFSTDWYLI